VITTRQCYNCITVNFQYCVWRINKTCLPHWLNQKCRFFIHKIKISSQKTIQLCNSVTIRHWFFVSHHVSPKGHRASWSKNICSHLDGRILREKTLRPFFFWKIFRSLKINYEYILAKEKIIVFNVKKLVQAYRNNFLIISTCTGCSSSVSFWFPKVLKQAG
jgi:hypothetical protein